MVLFRRGPKLFTALCGHQTLAEGVVTAYGEVLTMPFPRNVTGKFVLCADCLSKKAIMCAWCTRVIFVGEPVTLRQVETGDALQPHAVKHGTDWYVGCLHPKCQRIHGSAVGVWTFNVTTGAPYVGEVEPGSKAYSAACRSSRWALNQHISR